MSTGIERICHLPVDFRAGSKSAVALVRESGVEHRSLTAAAIAPLLQANPQLIKEWLHWSEDKRSAPSYYFIEEKGKWVVGRHPGQERVEFSNAVDACADFIAKEVNSIW